MVEPLSSTRIRRRTVLRTAAGAAGALALAPLIQACQATTTPVPAGSPRAAGLKLPTYKPHGLEWGLPKPDLPPDGERIVSPAYFKYPKGALVQTFKQPPGDGSVITGWGQATPPPAAENRTLTGYNKLLNADLRISGPTGEAEQRARIAVMMAGADPKEFPDFLWIRNETNIRGLNEFLDQEYTDLGPYLAGDKVLEYPNLAAIPSYMWKNSVRNGKLMGVMNGITTGWGEMAQMNEDMWKAVGGPPKTADEFLRMAKDINRPRDGIYAIGDSLAGQLQTAAVLSFFQNLWAAPNSWRLDKGKLVKEIETDEVKAAVEFCRSLYAAGLVHPDAPAMTSARRRDQIYLGKVAFLGGFSQGSFVITSWAANRGRVKLRSMEPFGWDGKTKPNHHFGSGSFGITAIKKSSEDRTKMLLRVADAMSAPVGTVEYERMHYGVEGHSFNYDKDGNPVTTTTGNAELTGLRQVIDAPDPIYSPFDSETLARLIHGFQTRMAAIGVRNPTIGLGSPTYNRIGPVLNQLIIDTSVAVVTGRSPMSAWDQLVTDWRSRGGERLRGEFEEALGKQ